MSAWAYNILLLLFISLELVTRDSYATGTSPDVKTYQTPYPLPSPTTEKRIVNLQQWKAYYERKNIRSSTESPAVTDTSIHTTRILQITLPSMAAVGMAFLLFLLCTMVRKPNYDPPELAATSSKHKIDVEKLDVVMVKQY